MRLSPDASACCCFIDPARANERAQTGRQAIT